MQYNSRTFSFLYLRCSNNGEEILFVCTSTYIDTLNRKLNFLSRQLLFYFKEYIYFFLTGIKQYWRMSYYEYKSCLSLYKTKIRGKFYFLNGTVYSRSTRRGAHPNETNSLTHDYNWSSKVSRSNSKIFLLPSFLFSFTSNGKEIIAHWNDLPKF